MKLIEDWLIARGKVLSGRLGDKAISTSLIMELDGDVVTTKSGSLYKLGAPHPYMEMADFLEGQNTPLEAVRFVAARNQKDCKT